MRRRLTLFSLLTLLIAGSAPAQTSGETGVPVRGTVVNSVTRQPIARALVSLEGNGLAMLTDNEGRFAFDNVPAGAAVITCRRPGYGEAGSSGGAGGDRTQTPVQVGAGMPEVTLELQPQAAIVGQVLLSGDDPPEDLRVQLLERRIREGHGQWSTVRVSSVTSDGRFRFGNLQPGAYLVHVATSMDPVPAPFAPANLDQPRTGYVATYAPGVGDIASAQVFTLSAGQQVESRIRVNRETYYPVTARVSGAPEGGPGSGMGRMGFSVSGGSLLGLPARYSREDGLVHALLPTGHYALSGHSYGPAELTGLAEFDVRGGPVSGLTIALTPVQKIPILFRRDFTSSTQPVPAGMGPGAQVQLTREDSLPNGQGYSMVHPESAAPDTYELDGVQPGQYHVSGSPYVGYIAALTSGGVDLLREPLSVNSAGGSEPIEVSLRNDFGGVSASLGSSLLAGDEGALGAVRHIYVHLEPLPGPGVERVEQVNAGGQLQLTNVVPGDYVVFAALTRAPIEYRSVTVMASLSGVGQAVTVAPSGSANLTIDKLAVLP